MPWVGSGRSLFWEIVRPSFWGVLGLGREGVTQGVGGGPYGGGERVDVSTSMSVGRHGGPQVVVAHWSPGRPGLALPCFCRVFEGALHRPCLVFYLPAGRFLTCVQCSMGGDLMGLPC